MAYFFLTLSRTNAGHMYANSYFRTASFSEVIDNINQKNLSEHQCTTKNYLSKSSASKLHQTWQLNTTELHLVSEYSHLSWNQLLQCPSHGRSDSRSELGGHSLPLDTQTSSSIFALNSSCFTWNAIKKDRVSALKLPTQRSSNCFLSLKTDCMLLGFNVSRGLT